MALLKRTVAMARRGGGGVLGFESHERTDCLVGSARATYWKVKLVEGLELIMSDRMSLNSGGESGSRGWRSAATGTAEKR